MQLFELGEVAWDEGCGRVFRRRGGLTRIQGRVDRKRVSKTYQLGRGGAEGSGSRLPLLPSFRAGPIGIQRGLFFRFAAEYFCLGDNENTANQGREASELGGLLHPRRLLHKGGVIEVPNFEDQWKQFLRAILNGLSVPLIV